MPHVPASRVRPDPASIRSNDDRNPRAADFRGCGGKLFTLLLYRLDRGPVVAAFLGGVRLLTNNETAALSLMRSALHMLETVGPHGTLPAWHLRAAIDAASGTAIARRGDRYDTQRVGADFGPCPVWDR